MKDKARTISMIGVDSVLGTFYDEEEEKGETGDRFLFHTLYLYVIGMCLEELKDKYDELGN